MERLHAIALTLVRPQMTLIQLNELYTAAGDATRVIENGKDLSALHPEMHGALEGLDTALALAKEKMDFCEKHGVEVITLNDERYPKRMKECVDAPIVIYYRGSADLNASYIVSIVGTRKCTPYGQDMIRRLVADLSKAIPNAVVISGLAYGVDITAHRAALDNGLDTIGVLAHGLDMIYPSVHRDTAKAMLRQGGVLTEFCPGTRIDKRNFLQRNRIIAAMSDCCILPESAEHGGGLVTCRLSMDYGRQVFAFPGNVGMAYSEGCNKIIRNHIAQLVTSCRDVLEDMGWESAAVLQTARDSGIERELFPELSREEKLIVEALRQGDLLQDQIVAVTSLPVNVVASSLFSLEMSGVMRALAGGLYHLVG